MIKMNHGLKFLGLITLIVTLFACASEEEGALVTGTIEGADGEMVYLNKEVNGQPIYIDSTKIKGGDFTLRIEEPELNFYRLSLSDQNAVMLVIDTADQVVYQGNSENLSEGYSVEGSVHTQVLQQFNSENERFQQTGSELQERIRSMTSKEDMEERNDLIKELNQHNKNYYEFIVAFIEENSSSPAVLYAVGLINPEQNMEVYKQVEEGLKGVFDQTEYYRRLVAKIRQIENEAETKKAMQAQQQSAQGGIQMGQEAPDIRMEDPQGNVKALSDLRGKYVLIDFWASWCKPCRIENPHVVKMYEQYKNKGFEIYAVSLDRNRDHWLKAIDDDGLGWIHVSDLKFWNSAAAKLYGVNSIPYTVLLDKEGKVIGTRLRGKSLEAKLKEVLG